MHAHFNPEKYKVGAKNITSDRPCNADFHAAQAGYAWLIMYWTHLWHQLKYTLIVDEIGKSHYVDEACMG